jgi:prepilin-type N-terminal cleavage/methylation domain-containing protein
MADRRYRHGLTLLEMLVVVGVIAVLAAAVIALTRRVDYQSKEKVLANTFAVLNSALRQFYDYGYQFPSPYEDLRFPPDCSGFHFSQLRTVLPQITGAVAVDISNHNDEAEPDATKRDTYLQYSGCEVMYFFLSQVPESRRILTGINPAFVTNKNMYGRDIQIQVGSRPPQPLPRVVDPWGTTLRYDYYVEHLADGSLAAPKDFWPTHRDFPVLVSAGPDKQFNTADDISSRK